MRRLFFVILIILTLSFLPTGVFAANASVAVNIDENIKPGAAASARVILDCNGLSFIRGTVNVLIEGVEYANLDVQSEVGITDKISVGSNGIVVSFSFSSVEGIHDLLQLGTVKFDVIKLLPNCECGRITATPYNFADMQYTVCNQLVNNASVTFNVSDGTTPAASGTSLQTASATAAATATLPVTQPAKQTKESFSNIPSDAPKPSASAPEDSTEIIGTEIYSVEQIEQMSTGAIVFWSIVALIGGIWIGIGIGYVFWYKKSRKMQVRDADKKVIGHLD